MSRERAAFRPVGGPCCAVRTMMAVWLLLLAGWGYGGLVPCASSADDVIAYTFQDAEQMEEYASLWQQLQGIRIRLSVLRAYWAEERAALTELNDTLNADFNLDPEQRYIVDPGTRRVMVHHPSLEADDRHHPQPGADPEAAYSFDDQDAMELFMLLTQQQAGQRVRLKVLEAYLSEEEALHQELGDELERRYGLDVTKHYVIDPIRRVLVDQPEGSAASPSQSGGVR